MAGGKVIIHSLFTSMRIKLAELRKIIANEVRIFLTEINGDNPGGDPEEKIKDEKIKFKPLSRGSSGSGWSRRRPDVLSRAALRTASLTWGKDEEGKDLHWNASHSEKGFEIFTIHDGIIKWIDLNEAPDWTFDKLTNEGVTAEELNAVLNVNNLVEEPSRKRI